MNRVRRILTATAALITVVTLTVTLSASPASARRLYLAGLWLMNEGSGQVTHDYSFSGNRGMLGSTPGVDAHDPAWVALPRVGFFRQAALRFNGSQRVTVANAPSLEPDGVTVVARVRGTYGGPYRYLASKGSLACTTASYGLYTGAAGGLTFYVSDGTSFAVSADAGAGLWDGGWHLVAGAYDGTHVRLWVDGRQVGEPVAADIDIAYGLPDSQDFLLGDYAGSCGRTLGFVGDIDAAAVIGRYERNAAPGMRLGRGARQ